MKKLIISAILMSMAATSAFSMNYEEAKKADKPIVIMFHAKYCGACKQIEPEFKKLGTKFSDKFNFVEEDIANSKIAYSFSFDSVPSFFIVKPGQKGSTKISYDCASDMACFTKKLNEYK